MANEQTSDPGFKGMNREQLDAAAPDYGLDPSDFPKVDDLRAALIEAHEAKADHSNSNEGSNNDEVEAPMAEMEEVRTAMSPKSHSVDPVIHDATRDKPWITNDVTAKA